MQHRVFGAARCRKSLEAMAVAVAVAALPRRDARRRDAMDDGRCLRAVLRANIVKALAFRDL